MGLDARIRARRAPFELELSLAVAPGEVTAVVGPNGAGKTTLLRCLAGLVPLDEGRVVLDGQVLEDTAAGIWVAPERRPVGMVFQGSWLFPHLSVVDNIAFGLPGRRSVARRLARPWVDVVGLGALAGTRAGSLSGGEAQRAALARALAPRPRLLLLDEPLAAVDAAARPGLRRLVAETLSGYEGARVVVTHEPLEALTLAHRLLVLEAGRVTQAGTVAEVTAQPRSPWVAAMVGLNLFRGTARDGLLVVGDGSLTVASDVTGEVFAVVHPRAVTLSRDEPHGSARNVWSGVAGGLDLEGERVRVRVEGSPAVVAEVTPAAAAELGLAGGGRVWASVKATEIDVYPA